CLRIHFAIHHQPCFPGGLEHQFPRAGRHRRPEHRHQSHHRPAAVLPVNPVTKKSMQTDFSAKTQRFAETRRGFLFFALLGFVLRANYLVITQAIRQSKSSMKPWSGKPFALVPEPFPKFGRASAEEEIMKTKLTSLDNGS